MLSRLPDQRHPITNSFDDFVETQKRAEAAHADGGDQLDPSDLSDLMDLPSSIGDLKHLKRLWLNSTDICKLDALTTLTGLEQLYTITPGSKTLRRWSG